jgi:hypothetical protein
MVPAPTVIVAYSHRINTLLDSDSGALLVAAYKQGGMPLVNSLSKHDGSTTSNAVVRVTFEDLPSATSPKIVTPSKIGRFEYYWRNWQYRAEIQKLDSILKKHNINLTPEQALASKLYRGELFKLHPDKVYTRNNPKLQRVTVEDAQFYKEFLEEFNNPYIQRTQYVHYILHSVAISVNAVNTAVDLVRLSYDYTWNNIVVTLTSSASTLGMLTGLYNPVVPLSIGSIEVASHLYNLEITEAATTTARLAVSMATPYAITFFAAVPGIGQITTGTVIAWSMYSTISNINSLCVEHQDQKTVVNTVCAFMGYNSLEVLGESSPSEL